MGKTERQKMLASEPYLSTDPELVTMRQATQHHLHTLNIATPDNLVKCQQILQSLFSNLGAGFDINPPFYCDYGCHIQAGKNLYINVNCTILDCNWVTIGDNVLIAPNVQIYTAYHPTDPAMRLTGVEMAAPITIGNNVWIGGGAIICPGVTIGDNSSIGAGSVVTKNIPANSVAVGSPCRVIRQV
ncbi:sugar O-acetyltransferase [Leptothoe spongobia]|uniref:Acetyltransferase n=1 Tax=Leptothoe spongobia TAU-MAC 1115 TaxID=1967444 RepID=A0A947GK52_9CYAN|nr:sugar O-acetyltransferase [Leptothoe spongobia]MBT9317575.1 sugar O-acetyltransferase [Leptothoe spongobia TAU-MAC 1115]